MKTRMYSGLTGRAAPKCNPESPYLMIENELKDLEYVVSTKIVSEFAFTGLLNLVRAAEVTHDMLASRYTKISLKGWKNRVAHEKESIAPLLQEIMSEAGIDPGLSATARLALLLTGSAAETAAENKVRELGGGGQEGPISIPVPIPVPSPIVTVVSSA